MIHQQNNAIGGIQQRLTAMGFDTGGTDGRVGNDTMTAIQNFQRTVGM